MAKRSGAMVIDGQRLEYSLTGPGGSAGPLLVLIHEGLGCASLWRDFPDLLQEATGCQVLAYSRQGYGGSSAVALPRPLSYMHHEAVNVLPGVLDFLDRERVVLIGHSDGASIAAIHAGLVRDDRVGSIVLMAPHFFAEECGLRSIAAAKQLFEAGDLRHRLQRHHGGNVDCAFRGWSEAWLDTGFRDWDITGVLKTIRVPVLAFQGGGDEYGSGRQICVVEQNCGGFVETMIVPDCGHAPQRDQPAKTLKLISDFVRRVGS